ncbi:ZIP family metal transporter [Agriterribacter humi]|uniref:ZIP family metal transporter n=1 Tax=Agriterribacter humi TaxID=1104781 RepID=UPI001264B322|nr:ZIP family metal transporter [Agriterribacter humi]
MLIIITVLAFLSTLAGGLFALKFKDKLHLILGFSAGAVIGVSFLDLLPEALSLGRDHYSIDFILTIVALGFIIYMILDRLTLLHFHHRGVSNNHRANLAAGSLSIHSFFDGVAIGLAFRISDAVGLFVALAVIVHDFSDGVNTVSVVLKTDNHPARSFKWLLVDSIAPVLGVVSTCFFNLSEQSFALVIALSTGFFLYIGASDLLPESQHEYSSFWTTLMTILGVVTMYVAINFLT